MPIHLRYFVHAHADDHAENKIALPPDSATPCPPGYEEREANTLAEVDRLQRQLQSIEFAKLQREGERDAAQWADRLKAADDRLRTRAASSATTPYERDFIAEWLKLRDEKKREHFRQRFEVDMAAYSYFPAREFDNPEERAQTLLDATDKQHSRSCGGS